MSAIDFGTPVRVSHAVRPVYVEWRTKVEVSLPASIHGGFYRVEERDVEGHLAGTRDRFGYDDDLGLPLPDPSPNPEPGQVCRRLRRFPTEGRGIVVGRTFRQEGVYYSGHGAANYFGEGEYEPAFLGQTRTVWVYQVAVGESWQDRSAWPARIVDVIPEDLEVVSVTPKR